ncbi:hypothetical protein Poli38472_012326 [Pythium oligandrum]|uniref:FYVE-type domain-containing protein n=1 Tax=Pythium oligandrum TaxID=41045 RepID=A0A8K1CPP0_PYTOL|nr:hypothetical protein Poli38472_012326 [Pythium oligandrum]|eukprot:TMW67210.1 hypothetical protein Poli38472_012326 [Pythium oligandrum]
MRMASAPASSRLTDEHEHERENEHLQSNNASPDETDGEDDAQWFTLRKPLQKAKTRRLMRRRHSADNQELAESLTTESTEPQEVPPELSAAQKRGCFQYIKRRHSIAMAFAATSNPHRQRNHVLDDLHDQEDDGTHWEYLKTKHGVDVYKSKRSRCEIRGVTRVNASVKNVMSLLAAGESTEGFAHTQRMLLGRDQVLEARVLSSCVPATASRYFHCGLKYMAMKNPFGVNPLDLVFLDYTDVSTTPDDKLVGYRILESIRVPAFRSVPNYIRASLRCEVYIVRETSDPGVVEVTFASHLDPKSKYSSSKRHTWLDQTVTRLTNLRSYAEKASFSHRLVLEKAHLVKRETRSECVLCETAFSFLRKRHNCRLCGEVTCGKCSRRLPIFVGTETTRVRVCLGCILQSRRQPDELGRTDLENGRRNSIGNCTYIAYDEMDDDEDEDNNAH